MRHFNYRRIALFLFFSYALYSQAGASSFLSLYEGMDSGGGKAIVCFKENEIAQLVRQSQGVIFNDQVHAITSIEMIDYYYAKKKIGLEAKSPELIDTKNMEDFREVYQYIKERLKSSFPHLYNHIDNSQRDFSASDITWSYDGLGPVFDSRLPSILTNKKCVLTMLGVQYRYDGINYLDIDSRLFFHPTHHKLSQASLFLHEFIYLAARKKGSVSSLSVRKLNRFLLRKNLPLTQIKFLLEHFLNVSF